MWGFAPTTNTAMLMTKRIGGYSRIEGGITDCCRAFWTPRNFNRAKYAAKNPDTKVIITLQKAYDKEDELELDALELLLSLGGYCCQISFYIYVLWMFSFWVVLISTTS
jgi:hypothetical protein